VLPTRQDVGTEWIINPSNNDTARAGGYVPANGRGTIIAPTSSYLSEQSKIKQSGGYKEGIVQMFSKSNGSGGQIVVWLVAYRFDTAESAKGLYDQVVKDLIESGGFKEYQVSIDANCYGTSHQGSVLDSIKVYCNKSNTYFHVYAYTDQTFYSDDESAISVFPQLVSTKVGTGVVPEFPLVALAAAGAIGGTIILGRMKNYRR
jgi:hypothetical protein